MSMQTFETELDWLAFRDFAYVYDEERDCYTERLEWCYDCGQPKWIAEDQCSNCEWLARQPKCTASVRDADGYAGKCTLLRGHGGPCEAPEE